MKNTKGFTLIELLIVIGIIAILASGVIVAINPGRQFEQARNSTRWQHMNTIANAVYSYAVEHQGNLPPCNDSASTGSLTTNTADRDVEDCAGDLVPTYINELPMDPSEGETGHVTCYDGTATNCTGYVISSSDGSTITLTSTADEASAVTITK
jgi:type IV pilus assembly protein PilA